MSSQQTESGHQAGWSLENLVPRAQQIAIGLIVLGLAFSAIFITNWALYRDNSRAVLIWGICLFLFTIGVGVYAATPTPDADLRSRVERLRWTLMLAVGGIGALTALLGLVLPFCTMPMAMTDYATIFKGGPESWRAHPWEVGRCVAALIGGLILMFVGLQLARPVQRTSMSMRRWLYGYNAVLSSLLLLFILALLNLLPYTAVKPFSYAMEASDWTTGQLYTLHPATKNLLAEIKEPVKVYVLIPGGILARDVETLLNNCRAINPQITWEQLSRDRNRLEVEQLISQYQLPDSLGVLVVYGTSPKETTKFIKIEELADNASGPDSGKSYVFKGENALLDALTYLSSGEKRAVVYFTQGNGELDLADMDRRHFDMGLGLLQEDLNKINYQTQTLKLGPKSTTIPDDADILVLARPQEKYADEVVKALRDYLQGNNRKDKKKGKLIVLFDVNVRKGEMVPTGLEPLMAEYGVKVNNNRVLCLQRNPLLLTSVANPRANNAVARAFTARGGATTLFPFYNARTVEAATPGGAPGRATVEDLIFVLPQTRAWVETDLNAEPSALIAELTKGDLQKLRDKIADHPLPIAVTVTEGQTPAPIPGHEFMAKEGEPRMVVFGDASWVTNNLLQQSAPDNFSLFSSCLSWLSGRHDIGERIPSTTRKVYSLKLPPGSDTRLKWLPGVLMMLGVFALGFGVWVVRRR